MDQQNKQNTDEILTKRFKQYSDLSEDGQNIIRDMNYHLEKALKERGSLSHLKNNRKDKK